MSGATRRRASSQEAEKERVTTVKDKRQAQEADIEAMKKSLPEQADPIGAVLASINWDISSIRAEFAYLEEKSKRREASIAMTELTTMFVFQFFGKEWASFHKWYTEMKDQLDAKQMTKHSFDKELGDLLQRFHLCASWASFIPLVVLRNAFGRRMLQSAVQQRKYVESLDVRTLALTNEEKRDVGDLLAALTTKKDFFKRPDHAELRYKPA